MKLVITAAVTVKKEIDKFELRALLIYTYFRTFRVSHEEEDSRLYRRASDALIY